MTPAPATRPIRVVLIGFSTRSDNLGIGALTVSQVEMLRGIARDLGRPIEITIVDPKGLRTPYVSGPDIRIVDLDRRLMLSPSGYLALARRADLVIDVGAGDSFADIYGAARLRRMFLLKFLTHLVGTPLALAPQTIGPFTRSWSKRLALASIRRCALVATRDALSTQALRELGFDGPVVEASDLALRLPYDPPSPRPAGGPPRVGINVSGLLMNGGYTGKNEFGIALDYPRLMRDLIGFFQGEGAEVHLVAHVLPEDPAHTHIEDDFAACAGLAGAFPGAVLAPRFASPSVAKSYIAGVDFFMGARMHACIAAFSSGVPVVPMAYSRKFAGLFGSLGYEMGADLLTMSTVTAVSAAQEAFQNREALRPMQVAAFAKGERQVGAYAAKLKGLLAAVGTRT